MNDAADTRLYEHHADMCKVLSHPKRLELINTLRDGEMGAGELGQRLGISPANLSQHLSMMKERGILVSRKEGNAVYYRVSNLRLLEAFDILRGVLVDRLRQDAALVKQAS